MNKDITLEDLEKIYPVGAVYQIIAMLGDNPETVKKKLPKFGEWEYIGSTLISFVFKRIK